MKNITRLAARLLCFFAFNAIANAQPRPEITGFSPASGKAGTVITITGTNLNNVNRVRFGSGSQNSTGNHVDATSFTIVSPTEIKAVVGDGNTGYVFIFFPLSGGSSGGTGRLGFMYQEPKNALNFDGVDDYTLNFGNVGANLAAGGASFTMEAYLNPSTLTGKRTIIRRNQDYSLYLEEGKLFAEIWTAGAATRMLVSGSTILKTGIWTHVAAVWNGSACTLYVNGKAETATITGPTTIISVASNLQLGGSPEFPGEYFAGSMDEVKIWNIARTQPDIKYSMLNIIDPTSTGLVAYYNFDFGIPGATNTITGFYNIRTANQHRLYNFALTGSSSNIAESYAMVIPVLDEPTSINVNSFNTSWSIPAVGKAEKYLLDVSTDAGFSTFVAGYEQKDVGNVTAATVSGLTAGTTYYYRLRAHKASVSGTGGYSEIKTVVTTMASPEITAQPSDSSITGGQDGSFTVAATTAVGTLSYQWQLSKDNGNTFSDISNGGVYNGATTETLAISNVPISMNGYQYRVKTGNGTTTTSDTALLTVNVPAFDTTHSWQVVGAGAFSAAEATNISMRFSNSGTCYIAYSDYGYENKVVVKKLNGTSWETVGGPGLSAGNAYSVSLALDTAGMPYVAYRDVYNGYKATVMKFDGTDWQTIGPAGLSPGYAALTSLALDNSDMPYLAYRDASNEDKVTVMRFDGTVWTLVGSAGFSSGIATNLSLALDSSGFPYVAYRDEANDNKATVMRFDGTNWVIVGVSAFSVEEVDFIKLALDASDVPYVTFSDSSVFGKATVMRFNGIDWTTVGTAGFSAGKAEYNSLVLDASGTPYVAYADFGNLNRATMMKFDGTGWVVAGIAGFTPGNSYYPALALDGSGIPYLAFLDGNDTLGKVMKYAPIPLSVSVTEVGIDCHSELTGEATASVTGGLEPYSYSWNTDPEQETPTITGLGPGTYTVTVTDGNGVTATATTTITQPPAIPAPVGTSNQVYAGNGTIAGLMVTGDNIQWYDDAAGGTALATDLALINGTTYYASQTIEGCESATRLAVTVINISPATQTFCANPTPTVASLVSTPATGQTAQWYANLSGGTVLAPGTEVTDGTYYLSQASTTLLISTLAGSTAGYTDGAAAEAQFSHPSGVASDTSGNVYVLDFNNNRIRKINSSGIVTTFAGSTGGYADGIGTAAKFYYPMGIATDALGAVYVADTHNNKIRKISPAGVVTTLAGSTEGYTDGNGTAAQFFHPRGLAVDGSGNVYVADRMNHKIRKITASGEVTTFAGSIEGYFDGTGAEAKFANLSAVAVDASGYVYVTDNNMIRKITPSGAVTTLAGSTGGFANGSGNAAQFYSPEGLAVDASGNIYVGDFHNNKVRMITPSGEVTTYAGTTAGFADGIADTAQFMTPAGVAVDNSGNVYVADYNAHNIRKITPQVAESNRVAVNIVVNPAIPAPVAHDQVFCKPSTVADLEVTGENVQWYRGVTVIESTDALDSGEYYATQTINGCVSNHVMINVTVAQPLVLSEDSQQNVDCHGGNTGSASVLAQGGLDPLAPTDPDVPDYTYSWAPSGGNGATATDLSAGTYTVTVTSKTGCFGTQDFVITEPQALTVAAVDHENILCHGEATGSATVTASGGTGEYSYSWNTTPVQTTATATGLAEGNYSVTLTDANGCSIIETVTITQADKLTATTTQVNVPCTGEMGTATVVALGGTGTYSYYWNTVPIQTTATATNLPVGNYTVTVLDSNGCSVTQTIIITQPDLPTNNSTTASACDTYTWSVNGLTYTDSGTYIKVTGCHTETLVLTITDSTSNSTTASACDSYTWSVNGLTYTDSGTYTKVTGCHTETLVLTITDSTNNSTTASACDSYTWTLNGLTYTDSGTYTKVTGCHTETLVLTITDSTSNSTTASACDSYTWTVSGLTYTDSGTYTKVTGCHTETLVLTITDSTNNSTTASACDSYTWSVNGLTYTDSGTYTKVTGCHTETLVLTITDSTNNSTTASACDSYTWSVNGQTYTDSGTYTSVVGCHTETLVLTITDSTSNSTTASACDTYTWTVNGQTYTDSGTYTNVVGCHTETLVLTITDSTNNSTTASACDSYTWSVNGLTYTDSGTYTKVTGCHTETLVLTITDSTTNSTTASACDSYTWSVNGLTYTDSDTFTNVVGCHTETLVLTITESMNNSTTASACDSYTWTVNGLTYTDSGTYTKVTGCHTETLVLTITDSTNNSTTASACDSYTWSVNGLTYTDSGTYTKVTACHTETLVLTITDSTTNSTTASACDSYTWSVNGLTYNDSGTYTKVTGCHTETLVLTITDSTNNSTTASACDSYTWSVNGLTYTDSGTFTNVVGCHTETLVLTITESTNNSTTVSACDTYTWSVNRQTYTNSGTYTNVVGCHTETLVLTITDSTNNSTTALACDSYTWSVNGLTYTDSGTFTNIAGCHTETLVLTITDSTNNSTTASACDTYTWLVNGQTYTDSGTYTNVVGCHTETLVLTITDSTSNSTVASACDTYTWSVNGQTYTDSGTYTNVVGCHTETLVLTVTDSTNNSTTASACDTYTWSVNGEIYTDSGTYTNVVGCHTETLVLTITDSTNNSTVASACDTYTWSVNGLTYINSGTFTNVVGCHTETLVLTITDSTSNSTVASACDTYTWSVNGLTYTDSGTYTKVTGCHTETLVLTITDSTSNSTTASACDTYTWLVNGQTYTDSGTYTNVVGCHTETLVLTITDSTSNSTVASACDTYTWSVNGQTYTDSGTYTNVVGCHTETLVLTVTDSTNNSTVASGCDTYTWSVNGLTYTNSGTFTNVVGCHTETLVLTITESTNNSTTVSACDTYTWTVNGQTYTNSGTFTNVVGCHTETLVLTITESTNNSTTVSACDTYTWTVNGQTYTNSGTYTKVTGCHTETLVLTIVQSPMITSQPENESLVEGTSAVFTFSGTNLGFIQWQRNNAGTWTNIEEGSGYTGTNTETLTIAGSVVTTALTGLSVRAMVTTSMPCSDVFTDSATLTVTLGTDKNEIRSLKLYPNPTSSSVYIDYGDGGNASIIVWDIHGRIMKSQTIQGSGSSIDISSLEAGVYLFRITTANGTVNRRVIKE